MPLLFLEFAPAMKSLATLALLFGVALLTGCSYNHQSYKLTDAQGCAFIVTRSILWDDNSGTGLPPGRDWWMRDEVYSATIVRFPQDDAATCTLKDHSP